MPIADFRCPNNHTTELFRKKLTATITCPQCSLEAKKLPPLIAMTQSQWGDCTGQFGVSGIYDVNLGCYIKNEKHRDAVLKEKGLVRATECLDTLDTNVRSRKAKEAVQMEVDKTYYEAKERGLSEADAQSLSMPAEKILAGEYKDIY